MKVRFTVSAFLLAVAGFAQPAFEAATVKPSAAPDYRETRPGCRGGPGSSDPGRYICEHMPLGWLIRSNWQVDDYQFSAPKWMDEAFFEITAKVPAGATRDDLRRMMQALLKDRFRMGIKTEKKEISGFELVLAKDGPKLKESEPLKPGEPEVPAPLAGRPRVTMAADGYPDIPPDAPKIAMMVSMGVRARWRAPRETAEGIARGLAGIVRKPVINKTGLAGKYDVVVAYVRDDAPVSPPPPGSTEPLSPAMDTSGPTIFTAIQQQLGLKLEPKRVEVDFLTIERAERTPSEN